MGRGMYFQFLFFKGILYIAKFLFVHEREVKNVPIHGNLVVLARTFWCLCFTVGEFSITCHGEDCFCSCLLGVLCVSCPWKTLSACSNPMSLYAFSKSSDKCVWPLEDVHNS